MLPRFVNCAGSIFIYREPFRKHLMLRNIGDSNRLKGSIADVQRDLRNSYSARAHGIENRISEMQTRSRRGNSSPLVRIYRLVAFRILAGERGLSLDVRRKRWLSDLVNHTIERIVL